MNHDPVATEYFAARHGFPVDGKHSFRLRLPKEGNAPEL
jgi:hypothetical protein